MHPTRRVNALPLCATEVVAALSLPALLALALAVYWQGLGGPFLLDDFARLTPLGDLGGVTSWTTLAYYLDQAWTGPLGRPIALLSFLIDHNDWPAPARDFKYTNLLIHLLNGCLLLALLIRLAGAHGTVPRRQVLIIALFATAAWLLHPLLVSTTLYVVQRMTLLAATGVFAGLLGYAVARNRIDDQPRRALLMMTAALVAGGVFGVLAKGNAALIVPFALVLEGTLLPRPALAPTARRLYRAWWWVVLALPTLLLVGYLLKQGIHGLDGYGGRDFTSLERLMTEARILWQYLYDWFIPKAATPGLFPPDILVSRTPVDPWTTLPAIAGLATLAAVTFLRRRRNPFLAAAAGFFLAGHLLESTTIPLELFFEHRNYAPSALLWLPVGAMLLRVPKLRRTGPFILALIVAILAPLTHMRASTWGDARQLALVNLAESPDSQRAYRNAALVLTDQGRPDLAHRVLVRGHRALPNNAPLLIHLVNLECRLGILAGPRVDRMWEAVRASPYRLNQLNLYEELVHVSAGNDCEALTPGTVDAILEHHLVELPAPSGSGPHQLHYLRGLVDLRAGRPCHARADFRKAADAAILPHSIVQQAALLAGAGLTGEALGHLRLLREPESSRTSPRGGFLTIRPADHLADDLREQILERAPRATSENAECSNRASDSP